MGKINIQVLISYIISGIIYLTGGFDKIYIALIICMILDYITGILKAVKKKQLSSRVGFIGISRKIIILIIVIIGNLVDMTINAEGIVRNCIILFYICNECISILENGTVFNVPYPEKLKSILLDLKEKGSDINE